MEENYLLNYDEITGEIKGFFLRSQNKDIPFPTIEITLAKRNFYSYHIGKYKINIQTLEEELVPTVIDNTPQPKTELELIIQRTEAVEGALVFFMEL